MYHVQRIVDDDGKPRELTIPNDELKEVQTRVYERVLREHRFDSCVHSAPGFSVLTNAQCHVRHPYLSVFDIQKCFPSINAGRVVEGLRRAGFGDDVAALIARLTTAGQQLPQGAPTSPALLNFVLVDLDAKLVSMARQLGLTYTRYVDDLFLSGGERTTDLAAFVEKIVRAHRLQLNPDKRHDWGPGEQHTVTNIVVNSRPNALPEYVESVRAIITRHRSGELVLAGKEMASLVGRIGWVKSLSPSTGASLERLLGDGAAAGVTPHGGE